MNPLKADWTFRENSIGKFDAACGAVTRDVATIAHGGIGPRSARRNCEFQRVRVAAFINFVV